MDNTAIFCTLNNTRYKLTFNYTNFGLQSSASSLIFEYENIKTVQTKNKAEFLLKILFESNKSTDSLILSFVNLDTRDLCKNILLCLHNSCEIGGINYKIFIEIPILQKIYGVSHLTLNKFIETLNISRVCNTSTVSETLVDSLIKTYLGKDLGNIRNKINYISENFAKSLPDINTKKEINKKELEINESELIKQTKPISSVDFISNNKINNELNKNYEFQTTKIEENKNFPILIEQPICLKGNKKYETLLNLSKKCFNIKLEKNVLKEIIDFVKSLDLDPIIIKRINPIMFLEHKSSVNYDLYLDFK
ncbi:hypothetical protein CDIK_0881 [Cucumispora dikerogammari]|nr:hypothetical protein CDIK_0881 [Cucumispora dikerogammari]